MAHDPETDELLRRLEEAATTNHLDVSHLRIHSLPELPANLLTLNCNVTEIEHLPPLPPTLQVLECNYTDLTALPELPVTLRKLMCIDTLIKELPELPPQLEWLYCQFTPMTTLPELPAGLQTLYCVNTPLKLQRGVGESIPDYNARWREWREEQGASKRAKERCAAVKEELVTAAWHPRRVERWLEAGAELEDL